MEDYSKKRETKEEKERREAFIVMLLAHYGKEKSFTHVC